MVKVFNNIFFGHLATLARPAGPTTAARWRSRVTTRTRRRAVTGLLDEIGYDTLDLGPLAEGWRTQRDTAAYGTIYAADPADWAKGPEPAPASEVARGRRRASQRYRDAS